MWISTKRYDELWQKRHDLQLEKESLIRLLSGVILNNGGEITIPIPSTDSRTLNWTTNENGMTTIISKVYGMVEGNLESNKKEK